MKVQITKEQLESTIKTLDERISKAIEYFRDYTSFLAEAWKEDVPLGFVGYYPDIIEVYQAQKLKLKALTKWSAVWMEEEQAEHLLRVYDISDPTQIDDELLSWMKDYAERMAPTSKESSDKESSSAGEPTWEPGGGATAEEPTK